MTDKNTTHAFASGATSSEHKPAIGDIPLSFIKRVGQRFALGAEKHGRGNFARCLGENGRVDINFVRDRYNHAIEHLFALGVEGTTPDDHIGAVAWFLAFASWLEDRGYFLQELLQMTTPEAEKGLQDAMGIECAPLPSSSSSKVNPKPTRRQ